MLFLNQNENWHVIEELLHLICYLFLEIDDKDEFWYLEAFKKEVGGDEKAPYSVNFREILTRIAIFLDHDVNNYFLKNIYIFQII